MVKSASDKTKYAEHLMERVKDSVRPRVIRGRTDRRSIALSRETHIMA
jgi:hypothetical protein